MLHLPYTIGGCTKHALQLVANSDTLHQRHHQQVLQSFKTFYTLGGLTEPVWKLLDVWSTLRGNSTAIFNSLCNTLKYSRLTLILWAAHRNVHKVTVVNHGVLRAKPETQKRLFKTQFLPVTFISCKSWHDASLIQANVGQKSDITSSENTHMLRV